jgi:uncharacterized repeat protein (TIGR03803 family)
MNMKLKTFFVLTAVAMGIVPLSAQTFTVLHSFTGSDGTDPFAGLILSGNTLYGTAYVGGGSGYGTMFKLNTNGTGFTILHSFNGGSDGAQPIAGVILSGNTLYGTAYVGGSSGHGTVFKVNTDGTGFTILHTFTATSGANSTNSDGAYPYAGLILSGNTLYGTAYLGGSSGFGTGFAVNTNGTGFTNLHSFTARSGSPSTNSDGANPLAGLILSGNTLYGTATYGGSSGYGTVFTINTNGTGFTTLHTFTGVNDGGFPEAGLILSGNTLYGTANGGGSSGNGTVFAVNTDGTGFTTLHTFTGVNDGANPYAGLILSGNTLYGTAAYGGSSANGTVFAVNTNGTSFTNLHSFTATSGSLSTNSDGTSPRAALILSGNTLYGTAVLGGSSGKGTVFALSLAPSAPIITIQPQSQTLQTGTKVTFSVVASGLPSPSYQWRFNGQNLAGKIAASLSLTNVQFANAGGYSVIVTNAYGSVTSAIAQLTVFTNLALNQTNKTPPPPGSPTIPTDATHFKVFTNSGFVSGIGLDPNKSTIILTHGWNDSSATWPLDMANNIKFELGSSTPNIVAWDWTVEAHTNLPLAAFRTQGQGQALGSNLVAALGANYSKRIHFIGHSLGSLVNAKAANYIHANGFSWMNTQMTLLDEAEVAWGLIGNSWATLTSLLENDSSPQQDWKHPLPDLCAWADNYITSVGMPHSQAVNVILTNLTPDVSNIQNLFDFGIGAWTGQFKTEITDYHHYSYIWYINTVSQINNPNDPPYLMGFLRSWEGGGYYDRPSANTYYIESKNCPPSFPSYSGYDPAYNLVQINSDQTSQYLNARPQNLISQVGVNLVSSTDNILANNNNQQVQLLNGPTVNASSQITGPAYALATLIKLFTTSLINGNVLVRPMGGPVPLDGSGVNSPAYVWIPVTVPSNALAMAFNFMLQGDGKQDFFRVALNSNNLMTVETVLIQTNVTMSSGMIDVSQYAGQQAELFFGIVGGTSTNASVTVSDISFYVTLPPSLQIQLAGTNVVVTWPLSATGYVLQSANKLTPPVSWTTVTNVPLIVNFQYTVTNQISSGSRFYRLATLAAPTLQAQVSGKSFVLSWPTSAQNFSLQTTTNLADPNSWITVTNTPAIVNLQCQVTNQISGATRFYRLKQ